MNTNLEEFKMLEFYFATPGGDNVATKTICAVDLSNRFAVNVVGGTGITRKGYVVAFEYDLATKNLKFIECAEKPEVHLSLVYGYKEI